jgi:hypothetical protein
MNSVKATISLINELKETERVLGIDLKPIIEYHRQNALITIETAKARDGAWVKYLVNKR